MKTRHPILVILWTYGLFILVNLTQYLWIFAAVAATGSAFGEIAGGSVRTPTTLLIRGLVGAPAGALALAAAIRFLWRRDRMWLGLDRRLGLAGWGILGGLAGAAVVLGALSVSGTARVAFSPHPAGVAGLVRVLVGDGIWILFSAALEEVVVRGMATREIAARDGWPAGILVGGLYFGAMHLLNVLPALTWDLALWILVGGLGAHLVFTALLIRSGSLWLPIGVHAGWNFALAALAGTTLSGTEPGFGLLRTELSGPALLTGGDFGLELSVVSLAVYGIAGGLLLVSARGRGLTAQSPPPRS